MNINSELLPSNRKFGIFFSFIFFILTSFIFYKNNFNFNYYFLISLILLMLTIFFTVFSPSKLLFFNIMWFKLGMLLNRIVSPIVLGIIFYCIFSPFAIITRDFGRDELKLKKRSVETYWIERNPSDIEPSSFKDQF